MTLGQMNFDVLKKFDVAMEPNAKLSAYTTFQLGGSCPCVITCSSPLPLKHTVKYLSTQKEPFIVIGAGSNLVVSDEGVDCIVVRYISDTPLIRKEGRDIIVSGSTALDLLASYAVEHGLSGINFATGIPGTIGGAITGNAGAFGKQVSDCLKSVILLSKEGKKKEMFAGEMEFDYRDSILKRTNDIVLEATFALSSGENIDLLNERNMILSQRREKHPDVNVHPCAGSFFRNVDPVSSPPAGRAGAGRRESAGWYLEQAGAKDFSCGGAAVFKSHANIIVSTDSCRAQDVFDLANKMLEAVKEKYGIILIREVRFVGRFEEGCEQQKDIIW